MSSRLRAATLTAATVAVVAVTPQLLTSGAADARRPVTRVAVDQSYPVPASGRYTVQGHGYGHGRGMSQYGANGAATRGLTHEQILDFYYPGTELAKGKGRLRVLVTADTTSDVVVVDRAGLRLRDRGAGTTYPLPRNVDASRWRVTAADADTDRVSYLSGGSWHPWSPGGEKDLQGEGEFRSSEPITLVLPQGEATYRGRLRAARPSSGSTDRDTVNVVRIDDYVKGVVASEMPALWKPEAVQSQAVAARTYALYHRSRNTSRYYQICDTTACQVYHGVDGEHPAGNAAVEATARQVLTYDGAPAFTEFSSSSGGWTVASGIPYQVAKPDPYDDWSGNGMHDWSLTLTAATIQGRYPALGKLKRVRVTARDGNGQWRGRVQTMVLVGSRDSVTLSGDTFRSVFGLRSTWFRL